MRLFYINKFGIKDDIKSHIRDNRRMYILGVILLLVCTFFGIRAGITALNPYTALSHYNMNYYNLVNLIGRDRYVFGFILSHLLSLFFIYLCCQHYFATPLCMIVVIQKIFNFAVTITLIFRIFNFGATLVALLSLIPFFIIITTLLFNFCVYMYRISQHCYRYGHSSFVLFYFRDMYARLFIYIIILILLSTIGGGLTVLLTSSII